METSHDVFMKTMDNVQRKFSCNNIASLIRTLLLGVSEIQFFTQVVPLKYDS
jgi:hypothetical protein